MSEQLMLKYRPKKWSDVIGQDHVIQALQNGISSGDMHQTYIFSGPMGDGKCITCDTIVSTNNGLYRIGKIVPTKNGISEISVDLFDETGNGTSSFGYCELNSKTIIIKTRDGFSIEGTMEHPIRVLSRSGQLQWKKIGEIAIGDFLPINRTPIDFKHSEIDIDWSFDKKAYALKHGLMSTSKRSIISVPSKMTVGLAKLFGLLIAEGNSERGSINFTNSDQNLIKEVKLSFTNIFGVEPQVVEDKRHPGTFSVRANSVELHDFFNAHQMNFKSGEKYVPDIILNSPTEVILEFLRAYFEGDGGVDGHAVTATSKSRKLLSDIQVILLSRGIISTLREIKKSCQNCEDMSKRIYYRLSIQGHNLSIFSQEIGFLSKRKSDSLNAICHNTVKNTNIDVVPYLKESLISYQEELPIDAAGSLSVNGRHIGRYRWPESAAAYSKQKTVSYSTLNKCNDYFASVNNDLLHAGADVSRTSEITSLCDTIIETAYFYSPVESVANGRANVYDVSKDGDDHSFFANGFINHNTSSARILAACLNCEKHNKPTTEPCGECRTCQEIFSGTSSDIKEMNCAKERGIDDVRNLADFVAMRPLIARTKVVIADECHRLTPEAAESALKLFEEPPVGVVFILCTTDLQKMKATVHSRCLPFRFSKVSWMQIAEKLKEVATKESYQFDESAIKQAAKLAKGSVRNAMNNLQLLKTYAGDKPLTAELASVALGSVSDSDFFGLVDAIINKEIHSGMKIIQSIFNRGQDVDHLLNGFQDHVRSLLVLTTCQNTAGLIQLTEEEKQKYVQQYAKVSINQVMKMISLLYGINQGILVGQNPQLLFERYLVESTIACAAIEREEKTKKG